MYNCKEGDMQLPHAPDYNFRWLVLLAGMAILLLLFIAN